MIIVLHNLKSMNHYRIYKTMNQSLINKNMILWQIWKMKWWVVLQFNHNKPMILISQTTKTHIKWNKPAKNLSKPHQNLNEAKLIKSLSHLLFKSRKRCLLLIAPLRNQKYLSLKLIKHKLLIKEKCFLKLSL